MTDAVTVPETLREAPATVKLVYTQLAQADEPLTQDTLVERTQMPRSTVRSALYELELLNVAAHRPQPTDARRHHYYLQSE